MQTMPAADISHYTYRVTWSVEDQEPLAERTYSGKFNLRVGEALHRRLAIEAAEEKLSINQLIVRRLNTAS